MREEYLFWATRKPAPYAKFVSTILQSVNTYVRHTLARRLNVVFSIASSTEHTALVQDHRTIPFASLLSSFKGILWDTFDETNLFSDSFVKQSISTEADGST